MSGSFGKKTKQVFNFTCGQMLKKKGYPLSTIIIAIIIFVAIMIVVLVGAKDKNKVEEPTKVGNLIICNSSDIQCEDGPALTYENGVVTKLTTGTLAEAVKTAMDCKTMKVEWKDNASAVELIKKTEEEAGDEDTDTFVAVVKNTESGYGIYFIRPKNCSWSTGDAIEAGEAISPLLQGYVEREIDPAAAALIKVSTVGDAIVVGEDTSIAAFMVKYFLPIISGFLVYFMVLTYGQDVSRCVAAEKTSKLMEMMLSFVTPKALIFGKILASFVMSVIQVLIWVASGIGGYLVGSAIAKSINPDYTDYISVAFNAIRAVTRDSAMSLVPIILALLIFFLGLLLYYAVAGIGGSMVTKPEEVASAAGVLTFPVLICWMVGYFAALNQNDAMLTVCRYIPFTAPFTVPAEVLVGKISIWAGLLVVAEMLAATLLIIWIAGRIYRGLVLYNGDKLSIRKMIGVLRGK